VQSRIQRALPAPARHAVTPVRAAGVAYPRTGPSDNFGINKSGFLAANPISAAFHLRLAYILRNV
jgi:hypothetical protein